MAICRGLGNGLGQLICLWPLNLDRGAVKVNLSAISFKRNRLLAAGGRKITERLVNKVWSNKFGAMSCQHYVVAVRVAERVAKKQIVSKIKIPRKLEVGRGFWARHCAQALSWSNRCNLVKFAASELRFLRNELQCLQMKKKVVFL